jgi:peptidoglycan/LPS O-acetylase OafA/YrhL
MTQSTVARFYVPQLDGLRFFAFLFVFVHHLPPLVSPAVPVLGGVLKGIHDFGWAGVDLFLCLSGFLITRLLLLEWEATGKLRIVSFYVRRSLRIWPLYFTLIILAFVVFPRIGLFGPRYGDPAYTGMVHLHGWSFPLFLGNWTIALHGYSPSSVLNPLWTVSLEEQFYLTWPLIAFVVLRSRRGVLGIAGLMLVASTVCRVLTVVLRLQHPFMWAATITRLDPLAFGIILASTEGQRLISALSRRAALASIVAGVLIFVTAALCGPIEKQRSVAIVQYTATAIASACLLTGALRHEVVAKFLSHPGLRYLGKISYGLYAIHLAVISAMHRLVSTTRIPATIAPAATLLLSLAIVILLGAFSYRYLETPFLRLKDRFSVVRSRAL